MLMNAIGLHHMDVIMSLTFLPVVFAGSASAAFLAIDHRLPRRARASRADARAAATRRAG